MKTAVQPRPEAPNLAIRAHVHYWRIEEPRGPTSPGWCRGCGAFRIFRNSPPGDVSMFVEDNRAEGMAQLAFVPLDEPAEVEAAPW